MAGTERHDARIAHDLHAVYWTSWAVASDSATSSVPASSICCLSWAQRSCQAADKPPEAYWGVLLVGEALSLFKKQFHGAFFPVPEASVAWIGAMRKTLQLGCRDPVTLRD